VIQTTDSVLALAFRVADMSPAGDTEASIILIHDGSTNMVSGSWHRQARKIPMELYFVRWWVYDSRT
jgi:hypothetical protein